MNFNEVQAVTVGVLTDFRVIICAVCVFLYLSMVCSICNYRKKPRKAKVQKARVVAAAPKETEEKEEEEENEEE
ncbi:MAG: hypothetical protein MJ196_09870 [Treponemataceae bacterium]|nr:hypothetical protein [Treponemataceae bacterium]